MKNLRQQFLEHVAQTSPSPIMIEVERAEGVFLYSPVSELHPDGQRFFDLVSGVSVANVGHGRQEVVEAVRRQATEYMHTMVYGEMVQRPQVEYAARLAGLLARSGSYEGFESGSVLVPECRLDSVYFVNSGAEAVEGALKLAKRATGRREILAFRRAYHGSTHGSLSLMSSPEGDEWRAPFEPLSPCVDWLTFNDFEGLERISSRVACVVVEPVQGEAGVRLPEPGFLQALRQRSTEAGVMLIFDEIQTGMGRTGELFAFQKYGVVPDILCLAKAFGGGMPLGAFIASREVMSLLSHDPALGHITTFGGHPVCCAAGLAALEVLLAGSKYDAISRSQDCSEDALAARLQDCGRNVSVASRQAKRTVAGGLLSSVEAKGALFEELVGTHMAVREIRRVGLLMAVELADGGLAAERLSGEPGDGLAESGRGEAVEPCGEGPAGANRRLYRLMELFRERGIVSDWFLFCDTAFRISPPLTITEAEIGECCAIINECLDELE